MMHAAYEHFVEGGWGMWPILFWQIITMGIIVERAIYLFGASINKDVFLATMQKCILAGDVAKAVKMCSAANAPLARIVQAGLVKVNRPDEEVQAAMDEAAPFELDRRRGVCRRPRRIRTTGNRRRGFHRRAPDLGRALAPGHALVTGR